MNDQLPPGDRSVLMLLTMHPTDDGRTAFRIGSSFVYEGIEVRWVGPDRQHSAGEPPQLDHHLFPFDARRRSRPIAAIRALRTALRLPKHDVVYVAEPDGILIALALRALRRCNAVVLDLHELYGTEHLDRWVPKPLHGVAAGVIGWTLRMLAARCDLVMSVNQQILDELEGAPKASLVLTNSPTASFSLDCELARNVSSDEPVFRVLHGKSTRQHGTRVVLRAVALAKDDVPNLRVQIFEAFDTHEGGHTRTEYEQMIVELGIENVVELHGQAPYEQMPRLIASGSVGLVAYDRRIGRVSLPNRLFEYMAAGIPVVAPNYAVAMAEIVESCNCGLLVDMEDPAAVADAIRQIASDPSAAVMMGQRGHQTFLDSYSWEAQFGRLVDFVRAT